MAEWAYRTPAQPEGLTTSALRRAPEAEQTQLAEYWFRLNFLPFEADLTWFTLDISILDGPDLLAADHASPENYLVEEFTDVLPVATIAAVAARLSAEAAEWSPVPPDATAPFDDDPAAAARAALNLVEADLARVGLGHNQGPPLDPAIAAEIRDAVQLGLQALSAGSAGKGAAGSASSGLITVAGVIGGAFAQGVAKKAGEDAEPFIKHGLAVLLDHMLQAASALLHWIGSIPPGPLL